MHTAYIFMEQTFKTLTLDTKKRYLYIGVWQVSKTTSYQLLENKKTSNLLHDFFSIQFFLI